MRIRAATAHLLAKIESNPDEAVAHLNRALKLESRLKLRPSIASTHLKLASLDAAAGRHVKATQHCTSAVETLDYSSAPVSLLLTALHNLAIAHQMQGRTRLALSPVRRAYELAIRHLGEDAEQTKTINRTLKKILSASTADPATPTTPVTRGADRPSVRTLLGTSSRPSSPFTHNRRGRKFDPDSPVMMDLHVDPSAPRWARGMSPLPFAHGSEFIRSRSQSIESILTMPGMSETPQLLGSASASSLPDSTPPTVTGIRPQFDSPLRQVEPSHADDGRTMVSRPGDKGANAQSPAPSRLREVCPAPAETQLAMAGSSPAHMQTEAETVPLASQTRPQLTTATTQTDPVMVDRGSDPVNVEHETQLRPGTGSSRASTGRRDGYQHFVVGNSTVAVPMSRVWTTPTHHGMGDSQSPLRTPRLGVQ
ncbi:Tetratricopeptide repeat [Carpediemonas membranifera]|uniref:Tetratricopeptide repeat n=1 Tax=Carpediemonas membranifera TaxID=201153 RepID=A0A8J6B986_9EUKA|nr:Tetratricopeptide repeat [Carpediemonas membranifera]|eukprot:KAG9392622.1 Tetratricopeptide repeat [Carpediemonas membranifera]